MILVVGKTGQLGTAFLRRYGSQAGFLDRASLDLSDVARIQPALAGLRPSAVINCAAYTDVDKAESEPEAAHRINSTAVKALATSCAELGAAFVTYSTDYVFDGTSDRPYVESDPPSPISVYGYSKRAGEMAALSAHPGALIIRTSWVLSGTHANFAAAMLRRARQGSVRVVADQRGSPTLVNDLVGATLGALEAQASGILHMSNEGVLSWFELAQEVVNLAGFDPSIVEPCTTADYPTPAARPSNSVLESERLDSLGLHRLPHYGTSLQRAVEELLSGPVLAG